MEFMKKKKIIAAVIIAVGILIVLIGMRTARSMNKDMSSDETVAVSEVVPQLEIPGGSEEEVSGKTDDEYNMSREQDLEAGQVMSKGQDLETGQVMSEEHDASIEQADHEMPNEVVVKETPPPKEPELPAETPSSTEMPLPKETELSVETEQSEKHLCRFERLETAATCVTAGQVEDKCPECGKVNKQQTIEPLGHGFEKSIWETATCLKGGYYNNICKRCGLVESTTEDPLPHDLEDIVIQEGNCMEDTVIRHMCKSCGQQVESDTRFTPQTHNWISGVVDDNEVSYCEWCGIVQ